MRETLSVNQTTSCSFSIVTTIPVTSMDLNGSSSQTKDVCENTRVTFFARYVTVSTPTTTKTLLALAKKELKIVGDVVRQYLR